MKQTNKVKRLVNRQAVFDKIGADTKGAAAHLHRRPGSIKGKS